MATGDVKLFRQAVVDLGNKVHNLSSDVLQIGIVTSTTAPTLATAGPHWGGTGTTTLSAA